MIIINFRNFFATKVSGTKGSQMDMTHPKCFRLAAQTESEEILIIRREQIPSQRSNAQFKEGKSWPHITLLLELGTY